MPDDAQQHLNPAAAVDLVDGRHQASIGATVDVNAHGITPLPCRAAVSCSHCWCSCICLRKTASTAACSSVTKWLRSFRMKSRTPRVASTASTSRSVPQEAVSGKHRLCEDPSDLVAVAADAAGLHPPADHRDEHLEPELGIRNRPQRLSAARYSSQIIGAISAAPTPCAAEASPQRPFRNLFRSGDGLAIALANAGTARRLGGSGQCSLGAADIIPALKLGNGSQLLQHEAPGLGLRGDPRLPLKSQLYSSLYHRGAICGCIKVIDVPAASQTEDDSGNCHKPA